MPLTRREFLAGAAGLTAAALIVPPTLADNVRLVETMLPEELDEYTRRVWPGHTFEEASAWFRSAHLAYTNDATWLMQSEAEMPASLRLGQMVTLAPGPGVHPKYGEQVIITGLNRTRGTVKVTPPANATGLLTVY